MLTQYFTPIITFFAKKFKGIIWRGKTLANHWKFAKFAKVFPAKVLRYTVYKATQSFTLKISCGQ